MMANRKQEKWWIDFFKGDFTEVVLNQQAEETVGFMQRTGRLEPGMNVFDQCCGKGYLAHELDKAGLRVTGIDISEPYIAYAQKHLSSERATFVLGDASTYQENLTFPSIGTPVSVTMKMTQKTSECLSLSAAT